MREDKIVCKHIRDLLDQYYADGLNQAQTEMLFGHLRECKACRQDAAWLASVVGQVRGREKVGKTYHPSADVITWLARGGEAGGDSAAQGASSVDAAERARALAHIAWCSICGDAYETAKAVSGDLALEQPSPQEQVLMDRIRAKYGVKRDAKKPQVVEAPAAEPQAVQAPAESTPAPAPAPARDAIRPHPRVARPPTSRLRAWLAGARLRPGFAMGLMAAAVCIVVITVGLYMRQTGGPGSHLPSAHLTGTPAWQSPMDRAAALAAAGSADSAVTLADRAVLAGLTQYAMSAGAVPVRLYRDGVGQTYYMRSQEDAEDLFSKLVAVKRAALGTDSPLVAAAMANLGAVYMRAGKYEDARTTLAEALSIRQRTLATTNPDVGRSLRDLGDAYFHLGNLRQAEALARQGLAALEQSEGPNHPDVAIALIGVGQAVGTQWRHAEAEPYYKRAAEIRRVALKPEDPDFSDALMRLGNVYKHLARYSEAERVFTEAVRVREEYSSPDDPNIAQSLDHLAEVRGRLGEPAEAESLYAKARDIRIAGQGPDHPDVGASDHYLGNMAMASGRYPEAETYYRQGLKLREKLGRDNPDVATSLTDVAFVSELEGKYGEAERLYKRALSIRRKSLVELEPGIINPGIAMSLDNLAGLYTRQGKYSEAEPLYAEALSIWDNSMGPAHPATASALEAASLLYRLEGKGDLALEAAGRAAGIRYANLAHNAIVLTEEEALRYSQAMRHSVGNYLTCVLEAKSTDPARVVQAADLIFRTKGQVSDEIFERRREIVKSTDPAVGALAESLRLAKGQLAELVFQGRQADPAGYQARLGSLEREVARTEAELASRSADFSRALSSRDITTARLASLLPTASSLVEYVRFDYVLAKPDSSVSHYLALVVKGDGRPVITDLGEAAAIDGMVAKCRSHMRGITKAAEAAGGGSATGPTGVLAAIQASQDAYKEISSDLYAALWKPVESSIDRQGLVFIAPDGPLGTVSFAALTDDSGKYLIESQPVHYLASGRDLARFQDLGGRGRGLFAMGDPDYSASVAMRLESLAPEGGTRTEVAALVRNVRSACEGMESLPPAESLPGTRAEVDRLASQWALFELGPERICLGAGASEERLKAEAPGKRVIHLATHGFFLDETCAPEGGASAAAARATTRRGALPASGENPLLLSGVLLAGANLRGLGSDAPGAEDGIVTAYEISAMNLEGVDLVLLSACETGLGEVRAGEGIYGLRRSFQMAGARTVVSALWDVTDTGSVAPVLAIGLTGRGSRTLPEVMRSVELARIRDLRQRGEPDHPYTWGAFVATGNWK